jgi:hypothetical protein
MYYTITIKDERDDTEITRKFDLYQIFTKGELMELVGNLREMYDTLTDKNIKF